MAGNKTDAIELGMEAVGEYVVRRIDQLWLKFGFLGQVIVRQPIFQKFSLPSLRKHNKSGQSKIAIWTGKIRGEPSSNIVHQPLPHFFEASKRIKIHQRTAGIEPLASIFNLLLRKKTPVHIEMLLVQKTRDEPLLLFGCNPLQFLNRPYFKTVT